MFIAVVVKRCGTPLCVLVAVDAYTTQFGSLFRACEQRKTLRFLRRLRTRCLGNPVILTHQALWYHE
ncbi:hypothetical protein B9P99_06415 [Candidatus Marsarchaeota G1 archaeon OSP_B]|uniref:DDE domain-containing protein n=1 Tax=Candidatus Marsarchaeota G1 archaeon OSP_B TaxID=1978153 RepID=A0A2R6AMI0_9ARCH|nr:MAG: hypothetical protein B9P99_06415 [Candidatus Marsarchaeota G1 archaeon OSP_B]